MGLSALLSPLLSEGECDFFLSGQNFCSGMRTSVASGACAGSLMSATVRVGWPTVNVVATSSASAGAEPSSAMGALFGGP